MSDANQGNSIHAGDITNSVVAMGAGAQVIIQNIQSAVAVAREQEEYDRAVLRESAGIYLSALIEQSQSSASGGALGTGRHPYKSLYAYTIADADRFYGRDRVIADLLDLLGGSRLLVLHGDSGTGKSSVLQAGLAPRLLANSHLPFILTLRRRTICDELKQTILPQIATLPTLTKMSLRAFLHELQDAVGRKTLLAIMLDQFEVMYSKDVPEERRREDFEALADCLADQTLRIRVLIAIRDDFFGKLTSMETEGVRPFEHHYLLPCFSLDEARDIIVRPAEQEEITYEDGLVDRILADFDMATIAPSQLQIVVNTLADRLPEGQMQITRSMYDDAGGVGGILTNYLRSVKSELSAQDQPLFQLVLESLVGPDRRREIKTFSELSAELQALGHDPSQLEIVIEHLLRKRLILSVRVGEVSDAFAYEIVHDYIAEQIELSPEAQARRIAREVINRRMIDYQRFGSLLTDDELATISRQLPALKLTEAESALVRKSQAELRKQRLTRVAAAAAVALIVALALGLYLRGEARVAEQRIIAASTADASVATATAALHQIGVARETQQAELAAIEAAQAQAEAGLARAEATRSAAELGAARQAVVAARQARVQTVPSDASVRAAIAVGPNIWTAHETLGRVSVRDALTGASIGAVDLPAAPNALALIDGQVWVSGNTAIAAIDPISRTVTFNFEMSAGDFALDGQTIWVSNHGGVTQWDPQARKVLRKVPLRAGAGRLAHDGRHLWAAGDGFPIITVIDTRSPEPRVASEIPLEQEAYNLIFDGETIWATTARSPTLSSFDPQTLGPKEIYNVGTQLTGLASDGKTLWIADVGSNTVHQFDPTSGAILGTYQVGRGPSHVYFDGQRVWVFSKDEITTIIPLQIPVAISPARAAYDRGVMWMVDPKSQQVERFSIDDRAAGKSQALPDYPNDVVAGEGAVWVTLRNEGRILGLDPSGGEVETSIDLGKNADRIAVDPERKALWVTSPADLMVTVIDLPRRQVAVEYELPGKPALLALLDGSAWVATQSPNLLVKLDPRDTGEPPQWELDGLPIGLASDPATASLWIGVSGANAVQRFVPSRGQVTDSLEVATEPRVLIVDGGTLWVGGGDKVVKVPVDRPADATVRRVGRGVFSMVLAGDELWVASSVDRSVEFIAAR